MAVVYCCDAKREWYREIFVQEEEIFCGPQVLEPTPRSAWRPTGEYDLAAYVKTLPKPFDHPSLVVVCHDTNGNSVPRNLAGIDCPKVLVVGDTHHNCHPSSGPISFALSHMLSERYDLVIGEFNRQHLHFFVEAGIRAAWLPSFTLNPFHHPVDTPRKYDVTFIGQTEHHPIRRQVLGQLGQLGVEVMHACMGMQHRETSVQQSQSRINLNISLNGDLNLRCFEVLAAGGMLITDRLSPESGQQLLFKDREHLVLFDNALHLSELIRYYLAHPQKIVEIATAGQAEFQRAHQPHIKAQQLLSMVNGEIPDLFNPYGDRRTALPPQHLDSCKKRIAVYEFLQELNRKNLLLEVLFWPGTERVAVDAIDLSRFRISVFQGHSEGSALLIDAALDHRVHWTFPPDVLRRYWSAVVCPVSALQTSAFQQGMKARLWKMLIITDIDRRRDEQMINMLQAAHRLQPISADQLAFSVP